MKLAQSCHRCEDNKLLAIGINHYEVTGKLSTGEVATLHYNTTEAFAWAEKNLKPEIFTEEMTQLLILVNMSETFCGMHVDHVNELIPGLVGTVDGQLMLMDGTHRAMKRLKKGWSMIAYLLNEEQTAKFRFNL